MHPKPQGLTCKICDRGILASRKVFRLSGPAVVIGYLLLVPSVLGMIASAFLLFGVFAVSSQTNPPAQSASDASFRQTCLNAVKQLSPNLKLPKIEEYCECLLPTYQTYRGIGTKTPADQFSTESPTALFCSEQLKKGKLSPLSPKVAALYSSKQQQPGPDATSTIFRAVGGGFSLAMGVGFLVFGLLGWLLVMKKRVLKCSYCGAVISAS